MLSWLYRVIMVSLFGMALGMFTDIDIFVVVGGVATSTSTGKGNQDG